MKLYALLQKLENIVEGRVAFDRLRVPKHWASICSDKSKLRQWATYGESTGISGRLNRMPRRRFMKRTISISIRKQPKS